MSRISRHPHAASEWFKRQTTVTGAAAETVRTERQCFHEWVAPVERHEDGAFELFYPADMDATETIHHIRGQLVARIVFCRHCGAKPEGGE